MKGRRTLLLILVLAAPCQMRASLPALQAPAITPIADTFVDSKQPGSNFGTAGLLAVAPNALNSPEGEFDSFLKFDLSGTKTVFDDYYGLNHWVIQSIVLQVAATPPNNALFNGNGAGPGGTNVNAAGSFWIKWLQNNSWLEGDGAPSAPDTDPADLNYSNQTNYFSAADETLGKFSFNGATAGFFTYTLALTPNFTADVTAGGAVSFYVTAADLNINYLFHSVNYKNDAADYPMLMITAIPEPGTCCLSAAGMVLLVGKTRRR